MDILLMGVLGGLPTIALVAIIFISLYILGKGADFLVDEAIILSKIWGIPEVIIGATIVSLGTTIPELTVSVFAALEGNADLALGNAIGSIITNTTLILGSAALIGVVPVDRGMIKRQGGVLLGSVILLSLLSIPAINGGVINRTMGLIMLICLAIYIIQTIRNSKGETVEILEDDEENRPIIVQILRLMFGIFIVIISSKILIPSVEITATRIGIPESVIAATLVAFGTSVPELMTSITAVRRGHGELAVGNVIGANILNILFVVGMSAFISSDGLLIPSLYLKLQIPAMLISTIALFIMGMNKDEEIKRLDGGILLIIYIIYLVLNYFS